MFAFAPAALTLALSAPKCAVPSANATAVKLVAAQFPKSALVAGVTHATVHVRETIGPSGTLLSALTQKSSGNMAIDQAALLAARESTYRPKIVDCKPVTGEYLALFDFWSGGSRQLRGGVPTGPAPPSNVKVVRRGPCAVSHRDATVTNAVQPNFPGAVHKAGVKGGVVLIQVTIGPNGKLLKESIRQSSGNKALDAAALKAAKESKYAPKIVNCKPVAGTYFFRTQFDSNS